MTNDTDPAPPSVVFNAGCGLVVALVVFVFSGLFTFFLNQITDGEVPALQFGGGAGLIAGLVAFVTAIRWGRQDRLHKGLSPTELVVAEGRKSLRDLSIVAAFGVGLGLASALASGTEYPPEWGVWAMFGSFFLCGGAVMWALAAREPIGVFLKQTPVLGGVIGIGFLVLGAAILLVGITGFGGVAAFPFGAMFLAAGLWLLAS
jgi:hypothetical protein